MPVTVTSTVPAAAKLQDSMDVPDPPVTVARERVQAELSETSATSPVNPFNGEMVIVEVPAEPTDTVTDVGLAEIVKSGNPVTVYVTVTELVSEPLVPVTVTVTVPAELKVQDSVEVPEPPVTVAGVSVQAELSDTSATSPVNPFTGDIAMLEVPGEFTATDTAVGLAMMVKPGAPPTIKLTVAEGAEPPLVLATVTVTLPVAVNVHDRVEEPEPPVTVDGVKVQAELSEVRETSLENPFKGEMVTVDVAAAPALA